MPRDLLDPDREALKSSFSAVRARTEALAKPLSAEDLCVQTMPDVSPGKWHLAHVTWFWETFVLKAALPDYREFDPRFGFLFNSYYNAIGERHPRPERGFLTRPDLSQVLAYRAHIDAQMSHWLDQAPPEQIEAFAPVIATGLAHEEQHQELFLTDIKHVLSCQSFPETAYHAKAQRVEPCFASVPNPHWVSFEGGVQRFGHTGCGFAFDNEGPMHEAVLTPFALASRPVTNAEYLAFIEADGYQDPGHWLSDGWALIQSEQRSAPFYWRKADQGWGEFTLHGLEPLDPHAPVSHLDYYEASAYAAWAGYRLPEEREWEFAARDVDPDQARWARPDQRLHPDALAGGAQMQALFGEVWEWTRSSYSAYPAYSALPGALGEYNGKFMCGQFVLRGGSALTPPLHMRATYRNFFPPDARWQMSGLRLARDI